MKANPAKSILSRIDRRLKALAPKGKKKLSDRAASVRCELSTDFLRSLRRQINDGRQSDLKSTTVDKLAKGLETTSSWLLTGAGEEVPTGAIGGHLASEEVLDGEDHKQMVPLVGYVGAGSQAHFYAIASEQDLDHVEPIEGTTEKTRAIQIRGGSLGRLFDRWLAFYDDVRSPVTPDLLGRLCVVGLADGRVLIKQINRKGGQYVLFSNTEEPIEGVDIAWAALVKDMRPK